MCNKKKNFFFPTRNFKNMNREMEKKIFYSTYSYYNYRTWPMRKRYEHPIRMRQCSIAHIFEARPKMDFFFFFLEGGAVTPKKGQINNLCN